MNMIYEQTYINMIRPKLRNFSRKSNTLYNFSCPICGDSAKNKKRARGYLYKEGGHWRYHCHNCNIDKSFFNFIKEVDNEVYNSFLIEKYRPNQDSLMDYNYHSEFDRLEASVKLLFKLKKISSLKNSHPAKKFIMDRHIPTKFHASIFFTQKYKEFTNSIIPDYYTDKNLQIDEPRIIIPLINKNKKLIGFQGRSINDNNDRMRYITILLAKDNPKIFGLNRVNFNHQNYIVEGPFDSMFLPNSIATCGGKITSEINKNALPIDKSVIIYDNQPRNPEVVKNIEQAIDDGFSVYIWPTNVHCKDINDLVKDLFSKKIFVNDDYDVISRYIEEIVKQGIVRGLQAKLKFLEWRKV